MENNKCIKTLFIITIFILITLYLMFNKIEHMNDKSDNKIDDKLDEKSDEIQNRFNLDMASIKHIGEIADKINNNKLIFKKLTYKGNLEHKLSGCIIPWNSTSPPNGWALCNGQTINGEKLPDLRGRFIIGSGKDKGLTERKLNDIGGTETHTLTLNEIPSHKHTLSHPSDRISRINTSNRSASKYKCMGCGGSSSSNSASVRNKISSLTLTESGNNQAHDNMPPFFILTWIIKI